LFGIRNNRENNPPNALRTAISKRAPESVPLKTGYAEAICGMQEFVPPNVAKHAFP
jgi:hypothetical protein